MKKFLSIILALVVTAPAHAQQLAPTADSVVARAIQLAANNDSAASRIVLDSLISARQSSSLVRGEATYWLSRFAASPADRERVLGTLIVDHPFAPRIPTALYEIGMLELARNDRDRAVVHLTRYLSAAPADTGRVTASLALGRLLLELGEIPRACAVLLVGRGEVADTALELRNQFEFSASRCQGVDTTTRVDPPPVADSVPAPRRTGAFTVQVAAYETQAAADRLATMLRGQSLAARVVGTAKPFRVRVGRYATRGEAEEASRRVDAVARSKSIVVIVGPEER